MKLILIGGCSRSGKTFLAEKIQWYLRSKNFTSKIIQIDDYVKPINQIDKIGENTNWESVQSINLDFLFNSIRFYSKNTDYQIVEGYHAFMIEELVKESMLRILIEIDFISYINRRKKETRWGLESEDYIQYVFDFWKSEGKKFLKNDFFRLNQGDIFDFEMIK